MPFYGYGYGYRMMWDPTYILIIIGALLSMWASARVNSTFRRYSQVRSMTGMTGAEAAMRLLHSQGIYDVTVRQVRGHLTDHYDPRTKTVNLSQAVYSQTSVAALGVAAHECGHAIQDNVGYTPLRLRSAFVPVANLGSTLSWPLIILGLLIGMTPFIRLGIWMFTLALLFQVITLPVEFNASSRAVTLLDQLGILSGQEVDGTRKVLGAAALTYVAAVAVSLLQLLRLVLLFGGRSDAVNLAVRRRFSGLKGFVNGVLRTIIREKDSFDFSDLSLRYSMPSWLISMWEREYDAETTESMLRSFLEDRPTSVRCNLDRASREEICSSLKEEGVSAEKSPLAAHGLLISGYDYLEALSAFQKGWIQVQDASSALVGQAASPCAGDQILDVCGAPGGKSLDLADRLKGTGLVTVRDLTEQKVALIEDNIERSGFSNICAQVWDAREFDSRWENQADIVIADLPCSGLGIIGKKPDIKYQASPEQIDSLAVLQREILSAVRRYVKPGGKLIYSTCTISRKENQEQRDWILQEFPEFEPLSLEKELGGSVQESSLKEGYLQLLPGKHPCDGFFIAAFRKKAE